MCSTRKRRAQAMSGNSIPQTGAGCISHLGDSMLSHAANLLPSQLAIGLARYLFRLGAVAYWRVQFAGVAQGRSWPSTQVHPGRPRCERCT